MIAAPTLAKYALDFGPSEFLAVGICGVAILVRLNGDSWIKSTIMVLAGMAVASIGVESISGVSRFTFGVAELGKGIDFLPVAMGLFGVAEVLSSAAEKAGQQNVISVRFRELIPNKEECRRSVGPIVRGSFSGFFLGLIPGPSHVISTFVSYMLERKLSKHPEEFGQGAIEGVAGPESANNAAVGGAYVPLLALGIPFTPALAVVLGVLMIHGVVPGPRLMVDHADLFWAVIASMYIGNVMLLILNLPLISVFIRILKIPLPFLLPVITMFCVTGVFCLDSSFLDLLALAVFGIAGYVLKRFGFEPAPLVLAMVVGPMIEDSMRQALAITGGDILAIIAKPIPATLYSVLLLAFIVPCLMRLFSSKNAVRSKCR